MAKVSANKSSELEEQIWRASCLNGNSGNVYVTASAGRTVGRWEEGTVG